MAHAAGWSAPQKIVSSRVWQYERPQLARDVFGDAVVAWHRQEELNGRLSGVEAVTRRANAAWSSPVTLRGPRQGGAYAPEVAMDSSGNATAAWSSLSRVEAVSHPVGGSWGPTATVSQRGPRAEAFQLAVGAHGEAAVVYEQNLRVGLATRRPHAHWRAPRTLPGISSLGVDAPRVAIDARGEMIIAWVHAQPGKRVQALVLGANGKPEGPIQTLSRNGPITELQLAANADGDAVVVWREEGKNVRPIEAATRLAGRRFTNAATIARQKDTGPTAAINPRGDATILFTRIQPAATTVEAATRSARGRWSAAKPVAPPGRGSTFTPQVAAGPSSGLLMAVWGASVGPARPVIEASILSPQGTWQTPVAISPAGSFTPSITLSANGDATAAWIHQEALPEPSNVGPQEQPSFTESIETADSEPE
ncbi:MAG TPA: hypothetical protein VIH71_03160 [Solirubrobacteraceae bacterium]